MENEINGQEFFMENEITLHDPLTGAAKKYHKKDVTILYIIYKRTLVSLSENGEAHFTRHMIFQGERERAETFLQNLKENCYLQSIPNLDIEDDSLNLPQFPFMFRRDNKWEIGMISYAKVYSVNEGAKPFWTEE